VVAACKAMGAQKVEISSTTRSPRKRIDKGKSPRSPKSKKTTIKKRREGHLKRTGPVSRGKDEKHKRDELNGNEKEE